MITKRFSRGAKLVLTENVIVTIVGLVYYIILGWIMPIEIIGLLSLITFFIMVIAIFMDLSISTVSSQLISEARGEGSPDKIPGIARSCLLMVIALSSSIFIAIIASFFFFQIPIGEPLLFLIVLMVPALGVLRLLYISFFSGLERFGTKSALAVTVFTLSKALGLGLVIIFGPEIWWIIIGLLSGEIFTLILCIIFGRIPLRGGFRIPFRSLLWTGFAFSVMLFLIRVFDYVDRLIYFLGIGNLSGLGTYELSMRLLGPLNALTVVISTVSLPILSFSFANRPDTAREFISTLLRFYLVIITPICVFLSLASRGQLLGLVYMASWPEMESVFGLLVASYLFQGLLLLGVSFLQALGEKTAFIKIGVPVIISDICIAWIIVPFFGIIGVVIVRLSSYVVAFIAIFYLLWIRMHPTLKLQWIGKLVTLLFAIALSVSIINQILLPTLISFAIEIVAAFIVYLTGLRILHLIDEKDKERLVSTFPFFHSFVSLFIQ